MAGVDASSGQGGGAGMRRRESFSSNRSNRSRRSSSAGSAAVGGALIAGVAANTDAASYGDIQKASKQFKSMLGKGDWQLMLDHEGNKIYIQDGDGEIPAGKGEHILENVTTEQVLGTLLCGAARKVWDTRYAGSKLIESDNGFDQGTWVETHKAVFPHLGQHYYTISRGVEREEPGSDNGTITLVSRSCKKDGEGPKGAKPGHLEISGWQIEEHSEREVKVSHVMEVDPEEDKIHRIVKKILPTEFARGPIALNDFIDKYGYAPFFVRWGEGPATLKSDDDGDIRQGYVKYEIGGEGKGTMKDGQQKCWFQWSDKMYERGIDVKIEPSDAAELATVDGVERTLQIVWTDKVKKGATMTVKRAAKGNGADDVYVGGKYLDKVVAAEKGSGATRRAPPKKQQRDSAGQGNNGEKESRSKDDGDDSKQQANADKVSTDLLPGAAPFVDPCPSERRWQVRTCGRGSRSWRRDRSWREPDDEASPASFGDESRRRQYWRWTGRRRGRRATSDQGRSVPERRVPHHLERSVLHPEPGHVYGRRHGRRLPLWQICVIPGFQRTPTVLLYTNTKNLTIPIAPTLTTRVPAPFTVSINAVGRTSRDSKIAL